MRTEIQKEENLLLKHIDKPEIIKEVEARLNSDGRLGINIGIQEGLILKSLCSLPHVNKVVEIGTQYGCSATWMAMGLGAKGEIVTFEKDPQCIENALKTFDHQQFKKTQCRIKMMTGDARAELEKLSIEGPFDLIFIDANKAAYGDYLSWARKNISAQGIIAIDNIYLFGTVFLDECPEKTPEKMWRVMNEVIETQLKDSSFSTYIVPTVEGLMISTKLSE